ncbi:MAG: prolyl oligopeptidase family serine peptidase [Pirellulaceae bacterium]
MPRRIARVLALVLLVAGCFTQYAPAQTKGLTAAMNDPSSASIDLSRPHPFGVQDLVRLARVGEPRPSPDGRWLVTTLRTWNPDSNKTTTNLWLIATDGSSTRQLTSAQEVADSSPVWSPDSRTVAFVSSRSGSQQIWTIRVDGGEAAQLTRFPVDVDNLRWSPAGTHLAFSAEVYPGTDMAATAERDRAKATDPVQAMKFDRLFVRHWDTWFTGKRNHIFVAGIRARQPGGWELAGEPLDLMRDVDADSPVRPFGGAEDFAWSPDGQEIAYTAQLGQDIAWSTDLNIYLVPVTGGPARSITAENRATDAGPSYSPDGRVLAYRAMARPGFESDRFRIKLYDRVTRTTRTLTEDWDRSPGSLTWSPDSRTLYVTAADHARQKIFAVDVAVRVGSPVPPREIVGQHYSSGVDCLSGGPNGSLRIVYAQDAFQSPADIWVAQADGSQPRRLTHFNDERMRLAQTSTPDEFHFEGALGEPVQAWILKPVGFQPDRKYPVAFIIHGGPQGAIEDHFHYRWNPEVFAGAGYAVIAVNFHGSTGFGQTFTDSISGDWGGKPFEDLMKGLDYALEHYPWLDRDRLGALGASYGGWMINWINGHTNRFRCLVNHDGGFDEFANYFTTEELWFPEWEFRGVPWENPELFEKFSPSRFVGKWQTPTLVIHGAKDYRLVDAEGIATFTALQRRGIPSQLLYFPDENHWVLKPKNSILWHETILSWLARWLE